MRPAQQVEHATIEVLHQRANAALHRKLPLPQPVPRISTGLAETVGVRYLIGTIVETITCLDDAQIDPHFFLPSS
jgi:hypothetical protein